MDAWIPRRGSAWGRQRLAAQRPRGHERSRDRQSDARTSRARPSGTTGHGGSGDVVDRSVIGAVIRPGGHRNSARGPLCL